MLLDHFSICRETLTVPVKKTTFVIDVGRCKHYWWTVSIQHRLMALLAWTVMLYTITNIWRLNIGCQGKKAIFVCFLLTIFSNPVSLAIFYSPLVMHFTGLAVSLSAQQQSPLYFWLNVCTGSHSRKLMESWYRVQNVNFLKPCF